MFMNLWRAEWLKTRRRPANIGTLLVSLVIVVAVIVIFAIVALAEGKGSQQYTETLNSLAFPSGLQFPVQVLGFIGSLMGIVFMSNAIGSEYSRDTWKMILPRQGSRLSFLLTKLLMGLFCMVLMIVLTMVLGQLVAWVAVLMMGGDLVQSGGITFADQIKGVSYTLMLMVFYGVLALLASVVTRSTIGGIVAGFVAAQILGVVAFISKAAALVLPVSHLQNLNARWLLKEPQLLEQVNNQFGRAIAPAVSLAVVLGYIAVFIAVSLWLFKKRDMAGQ